MSIQKLIANEVARAIEWILELDPSLNVSIGFGGSFSKKDI
jgi:hypothetical protein